MRLRKEAIIDRLKELSDESHQRRLWLAEGVEINGATEMSSFPEAICGLFDDTGLSRVLQKGTTGFGSDVDGQFRELDKLISSIDSTRSPSEIMTDPKMARIRRTALDILRMLG